MENDSNFNQQDQGELLEQLSQLKNELARKQKKLEKARRSEKVKAHVKRKLREQAHLNREDVSQNCFSKSPLLSTLVSNSLASTFSYSCEENCSHNHMLEDRHTEDSCLTFGSEDTKNTRGRFQDRSSAGKEIDLFKNEMYKTKKYGHIDGSSASCTKLEANVSLNKVNKKKSKHSESKHRSHADNKISEVCGKKSSDLDVVQDVLGLRSTDLVSVISHDNCILKSPSFTNGNRTDTSPDILSGESSSEEICNLRCESKNNHRILPDSLAVTPSFVSTRIPSEGHVLEEGTEMPWHFDSELIDMKSRLNFNSETQLCDNVLHKSKYLKTLPQNNFANKDSQKVQISKESESKRATLHFQVQNSDKLNCTPKSFSDSETNKVPYQSRSNVGVTPDNRRLKETETLFPCLTQSNLLTDKSVEPVNHKTSSDSCKKIDNCLSTSSLKDHSSHSINDDVFDSERKTDWSCKQTMKENKQIMFEDHHYLDQSVKMFQTLPLSLTESDTQQNQTSSLPNIFRNVSSKVENNLSITRKRRRSNSFSDFSRSKRIKGFNKLSMKSLSTYESSHNNVVVDKREIKYNLMENAEKSPNRLNDICYVVSSEPENTDKAHTKRRTKSQTALSSSTVVNQSDNRDGTLESSDSDISDSSSSQSLLRPALLLKDGMIGNKKLRKAYEKPDVSLKQYENMSVNFSKNDMLSMKTNKVSQSAQTTRSKTAFVGDGDGELIPQHVDVVDLTECLDNEKTMEMVNAEREHCSENSRISVNLSAKSSCSDESHGSSDDVKIIEEISSENTSSEDTECESSKHDRHPVANYLDFTELDAIPFSQMELSQSFLSDPEAYQTERMKGSCRGRKSQYGMFVQRKSPRISSAIGSVINGHDSQTIGSSVSSCSTSSQLSLSHSEQLVSSRTRKSRKSLMISSLFQFLVDEAKRRMSEEEFCLPNIQYGCLLDAKCRETSQTETSESVLKHLTDTQSINLVHACSEELYSQDDLNDKHTISNVCRINTAKGINETTVHKQTVDARSNSVDDQMADIDVLENNTKHGQKDMLSSRPFPEIKNHSQERVLQKEDSCNKDQMLLKNTFDNFPSEMNNNKNMTEEPCVPDPAKINSIISPKHKVGLEAGREKSVPNWNSEFSVLSPNRGSFHGDACLPSDCLSSQSTSETFSQTTSSSVITEVSKISGKSGLRHVSCFQTGKDEPVLSLTSGTVISNNEAVQFVACISEYCVSLWSADKQDIWTNELDWLLPLGCCAKNLWLLPHKTKAALLISGLKNETMSWMLLFVYHWQTGDSSRLSLDLPATNLAKAQNSLVCCPLIDNQVILSCYNSDVTLIQKYSLTGSLGEIASKQSLEDTEHKLLSLSVVEDLNAAIVGLSDNSRILVWNHVAGSLLTQIDVSLILPHPQSMSCVQAVKGYLFLLVLNRSSENPGSFLAINPHIEMCKLLFHLDRCNGKTQSFKQSVVTDKIMAAVDEDGDIVLWDKYYGNLLGHLSQSHSTAIHLSKGLLFTGQENGCIHVMEIK